jgi:hypothetical protein
MNYMLTILGTVVCVISLIALILPAWLLRITRSIPITTPLRIVISFFRIVIGIFIMLVAGSIQFPLILNVIGILVIVSGVVVLLVGNARIQSLLDWIYRCGVKTVRIAGIGGFILGSFLIYAVL